MSKGHFALFLVIFLGATAHATTTYPDATQISRPNPEPPLPIDFDAFVPPVNSNVALPGTPAIAEWTKTAQPDRVVALTGSRFSDQDTQFQVFGQGASGAYSGVASILHLEALKAAVVLPAGLPTDSEYLVWPINSVGAGNPVAINGTEAWWIGPNAATRGDTVSIFGRNLSRNGRSTTSFIYIQKETTPGVWAIVTAENPYKVDFTVPAGLANGNYQVWTHNGCGGHYGWSGPLTLTVNNGTPWTAQQFNVKNYGAKGDGVTDDEAAINAAMTAASHSPWSTLYFPKGIYLVSRGFYFPSQVRWLGDGANKTFLKASAGFIKGTTYDSRRYCLFFSNSGVNSATFQDMTIDANNHMNGYLAEAIYMRFDQDLHFINVNIKAKGFAIGDFHGSNRVSFENCSLTGGGNGVFFGSATQIFLDRCQIFGTNDANTLLTYWGGDGISCTNTTVQDDDNSQADGWAQGRFFYGSSQWGSNRNIYIGENTTRALAVRPAFPDQNSGEQLLWENGTKFSARALSASSTTVGFSSSNFFDDPGLLIGSYDAVVVAGNGLGQHRKIIGCNGSTLTVAPAWNVSPDSTSTVIVAGVVSHCAIYGNTLQGKSDYATRPTASAGVQPYGNSFDFVVDGNTISQVGHGIFMWATNEASLSPQSVTCDYFNYVANNSVHDCVNGIYGLSVAWNGWPANDPYPGISYLANTVVDNTVDAISTSGLAALAENAPIGDQLDLNVFDHNLVTHTPMGLEAPVDLRLQNTISRNDELYPGAAPDNSNASAAPSNGTPAVVPTQPVTTTSSASAESTPTPAIIQTAASPVVSAAADRSTPTVATGSQSVSMSSAFNGSAVSLSFSLPGDNTPFKSWRVLSNSNWLNAQLAPDSGSGPTLTLTCSPASLSRGVHSGIVIVRSPKGVYRFSVAFTVVSP